MIKELKKSNRLGYASFEEIVQSLYKLYSPNSKQFFKVDILKSDREGSEPNVLGSRRRRQKNRVNLD